MLKAAVIAEAAHQCMTIRGIRKLGVIIKTTLMLGCFRTDFAMRKEFQAMLSRAPSPFERKAKEVS